MQYIAPIDKDAGSDDGTSFPDLPEYITVDSASNEA
jgi:hypothetical protein